MHHFILLLVKLAVTSPHVFSLEHGTVTLACLYVCFPNIRSSNVPSVFFCDSLEVRGVAYQNPVQGSNHFPAALILPVILL